MLKSFRPTSFLAGIVALCLALPGTAQQRQSAQQMRKYTGTVTETALFRLVDGPEHQFIKIETEDGQKIPVDLGRVDHVNQMDIQDGDEITIIGKKSRMNDKKIICAREIEFGDKKMSVRGERDRDLKRVQGKIVSLSTKQFKGHEQEFKVAKVDLNGGRTETMILGPVNRIEDLKLAKGDRVQALVRSGRYNSGVAPQSQHRFFVRCP